MSPQLPADEARSRLRKYVSYLQSDKNNVNLLVEICDLHMQLGEIEQALSNVQSGLASRPEDPRLRFRLASIHLAQGRAEEAARLFQELLGADFQPAAVRYNLACALACCKRYREAKEILVPLTEDTTHAPQASALLMRVLHQLGEVKAAVSVAERHLSLRPADRALAPMLSTLYLDAEDKVAAKTWAEKALTDDSNSDEALTTLGFLAVADLDPQSALPYLDDAIASNSENGRAWAGRALVELLRKNVPAAEGYFQKAAACMPTHIPTWHALATCQVLQNKLSDAEKSMNAALALNHNFGEAHGALAVLAILKGDTKTGHERLRRARALDPQGRWARMAHILLLHREGKPEAARQILQESLETPLTGGKGAKDLLQFVNLKQAMGPTPGQPRRT